MTEQGFIRFVEDNFPGHKTQWGSDWYYISASPFITDNYHFEYIGNRIEFHIEGTAKPDWRRMRDWMRKHHPSDFNTVERRGWRIDCVWSFDIKCCNDEDIKKEFLHVKEIVMPLIDRFAEEEGLKPKHVLRPEPTTELLDYIENLNSEGNERTDVKLFGNVSLATLLNAPLSIPAYQRIYCWTKKNVDDLFKEIRQLDGEETHLGSIILHKHDRQLDVVDGQQRLVTLSLLLEQLGYQGCMTLMDARFESDQARNHIAYNKYLCHRFVISFTKSNNRQNLIECILSNLKFSVLVIDSTQFELAYTFFSNANSKGKPLSDYNLLKAHHLRYIESESQQLHLANRWDSLSKLKTPQTNAFMLNNALGRHVLHLRKWLSGLPLVDMKYVVRDEYVASSVIEDIPAFGERFDYFEKIQGGQHFFSFAQKMTYEYKRYISQPEHKILKKYLSAESHWRYGEMIDALLFGYFLKFGESYLAEALFGITTAVSRHRHSTSRAFEYKIEEYVANSRITMKLNQATSPTFFLADMIECILNEGIELGESGIRQRYANATRQIYIELLKEHRFTDLPIFNLIREYHGIE